MTRATHSHLLLGLLLTTPLVACEFSKQLDPDGVADTGSTGAAGSTGDDGEMSETTVGPSTGAASFTSTSTTTTAGEDTTGSESFCDPGTAALVLEIDDIQSAIEYEPGGTQSSSVGTEIELPDGGSVYVRMEPTDDAPAPVQAAGYVRLPPDALTDPGSWFCFGETSTYFDDGEDIITLEMNGLAKLGPCPGGVPVEGSITACLGDPSCGGASTIEATLGAETFSDAANGYSHASFDGDEADAYAIEVGGQPAASGGQLGFRVASIGGDGGGIHVVPLDAPYFIVPLGQPDGGAIYCGGDGSSMTADGNLIVSVELVGLTRLGSCADGEATGYGMYCSNLGF